MTRYDLGKAVELSNKHGVKPFNNQVDEDILFHIKPYEDEPHKYARKIRITPSAKQKEFFRKAFGVSRLYYNEAIELYKKENSRTISIMKSLAKKGCIYQDEEGNQCGNDIEDEWFCEGHKNEKIKIHGNTPLTTISYRNKLLKKDHPEWRNILQRESKHGSIKNAIGSIKSARSNKRNGNIKKYRMGFKSKRDLTQVLYFSKTALMPGAKLCPRILQKYGVSPYLEIKKKKDSQWLAKQFEIAIQINKAKSMERYEKLLKKFREGKTDKEPKKRTSPWSTQVVSDFTIKYEYPNRYYLCIVSEREPLNEKAPNNVVALDPGVRTFQTYYSSKENYGKMGENFNDRIDKINKRVDKIYSDISKEGNQGRRNRMRKRCFKLRTKARNVVSELHYQTALFLCRNFENILLPKFETQKMSCKDTRKIGSKTVRSMLGLQHYKFYLRLVSTATHHNRNVFHCNEAYTSKTCSECGIIDQNLGSKKLYDCQGCGFSMDRDINGARNILLRHIGFATAH